LVNRKKGDKSIQFVLGNSILSFLCNTEVKAHHVVGNISNEKSQYIYQLLFNGYFLRITIDPVYLFNRKKGHKSVCLVTENSMFFMKKI